MKQVQKQRLKKSGAPLVADPVRCDPWPLGVSVSDSEQHPLVDVEAVEEGDVVLVVGESHQCVVLCVTEQLRSVIRHRAVLKLVAVACFQKGGALLILTEEVFFKKNKTKFKK